MLSVHSNAHLFSRLIARLSAALALVACLVVPAAAQVTYTGTTASKNFGSVAIGTPKAVSFSFSIAAGTTVGSIGVVTQGAPNLDFTNAAGTTCTAKTYSSATACVVEVAFKPRAAGLRTGAVVFFSTANNTGTQLGSAQVYGVGSGPQIAYGPSAAIAMDPVVDGEGLGQPLFVAVDAAGDLFISDNTNQRAVEVPAGGGAAIAIDPVVNGEGLGSAAGVAVDGAGNLFIGHFEPNQVVEVPAGGGPATAIDPEVNSVGLNVPLGLAADGPGDLFIADTNNNRVVEVPVGGGAARAIDPIVNGRELSGPWDVAVDTTGDLFIADTYNNRVVEVPGGGGAAILIDPTVDGKALDYPTGVSVDAAGNLFISDSDNNRLIEVRTGGGTPVAISPMVNGLGLSDPKGLAFDGLGDLFIADSGHSRVVEIQRAQPPTVNFPTPTSVGATDTTDGTETVQLVNIGNQPLEFTGVSYPVDFPEIGGDTSACTSSTSLIAGAECDLPIEFAPENVGSPLMEDVTLTDNALNVTGAQQSITVTGAVSAPDTLYLPRPGSELAGPEVTFTWEAAASGVTGYSVWIGSTGVGSHDLYDSGEHTAPSIKVAGLPTNGETIYVRLYTTSGKTTVHSDYTYTATTRAAITTPNPSVGLTGAEQIFNWTHVTGATGYSLWLGSTGPGSSDLYISHETTGTSTTVNWQLTSTVVVYARLYTTYGNVTVYNDYTYTVQ
jgi:hypothetical protein